MFRKTYIFCLAFLFIIFQTGNAQITFSDVASTVGISASGTAGLGFFDFDNDDYLDIYLHSYLKTNILYQNDGTILNYTFSDVTASAGVGYNSPGNSGPALIDYNNDGFIDIFLSNQGPKVLYKNNGDGTFTDVIAASGIVDNGVTNGKAFGDYNNDGYLDLYLVHWNYSEPAILFKNNGPPNWDFTDVTATAGIAFQGTGHGCVFVDYDNDGDQDIYVSVYYGNNVLYKNNGNGTFTNVTSQAGLGAGSRSRGIVFGDYDNDGYLDLYVTRGVFHSNYSNMLFRNNGPPNWNFTNVTSVAGVGNVGDGSISALGDYDNDGDLDIIVANSFAPGYTRPWIPTDNVLYKNNGNGTFTDVAGATGVVNPKSCGIAAFGDYNNDGFLDIYAPDNLGPHILYQNSGNSNNWLKIKLVGSVSNRDGFGSRISITTGTLTQIREVDGGNLGMAFQCSQPINIGLGAATQIDQIEVKWPSGIVSTLSNITPNQTLTINENRNPIADAGPDQNNVECTSSNGALVTLDGSGSTDPDDDPLTYTWRENGNVIAGPTTASQSNVILSLGEHLIELTVEDGKGETDTDEVNITVEDTTPPEVTAEFIPVDVEEDEGTFAIQCSAIDVCDPNPSTSALIELPTLTDPEIKFKEKDHKKLKIDLKKNKVKVEGPDPEGFWAEIQSAGGIPVSNGQEMKIKVKDKQKYEYKFDDEGNLDKIKAPVVTLLCTATDASGNVGTATANPTFEPEDDDDDDEDDDENNGLEKIVAANLAESSVVEDYSLYQNFPNPFNPETEIGFQIPEAGHVTLKIFNLVGQEIRVLADSHYDAGNHSLHWDAKDNAGIPVPSAVYLYQIQAGNYSQVRKMSLMR